MIQSLLSGSSCSLSIDSKSDFESQESIVALAEDMKLSEKNRLQMLIDAMDLGFSVATEGSLDK